MVITGEQLRAAALAAGVRWVPLCKCDSCDLWVGFRIDAEADTLLFDTTCNCSKEASCVITWDGAAQGINRLGHLQRGLLKGFGVHVN